MSQGVVCGFCFKSLDLSEDRGKLEPLYDDDNCQHQFHYLCAVSSLCSGSIKGQSNCPCCNQLFKRVIPVSVQQQSPPDETTIIITIPNNNNESTTTTTEVHQSIPTTSTTIATSPTATSSALVLSSVSFSPENSPSSSNSPSSPPKKPRKKRIKRCIFRDEAVNRIAPPVKMKVFGQPYSSTCQICRKVYTNRMAKSRCGERHRGPYPCPLCGIRPFTHHSSMRLHHLTVHGLEWTPSSR